MLFLSIIIPVFNVEKYLRECLKSVLEQSIDASVYEVIIVNDGSTDSCPQIIENFIQKYPNHNIIIVNQENKGLSEARNAGLSRSKGTYVWFIDADDSITSDSVSEIQKGVNISEYDIIAVNITKIYERSGVEEREYTSIDQKSIGKVLTGLEYLKRKLHIGAIPRFIYKKDFIINKNLFFYPRIYHEDIEFSCRALYEAERIYITSLFLYRYLIRDGGSITTSFSIKRSFDYMTVAHLIEEYRKKQIESKRKGYNVLSSYITYCMLSSINVINVTENLYNEQINNFIIQSRKQFPKAIVYALKGGLKGYKILPHAILLSTSPYLLLKLKQILKR